MRRVVLVLPLLWWAPLGAQTPNALRKGIESITAADITRRIGIIADDSMMGRDTPSPGLEKTARYVAGEFQRLGLTPGGGDGTYFQRYPILRRQLLARESSVRFVLVNGPEIVVPFSSGSYLWNGEPTAAPVSGQMLLIGGPIDPAALPGSEVRDRVVAWVIDFTKPFPANASAVVAALAQDGAKAIVAISNRDSAGFASRIQRQSQPRTTNPGEEEGGPLIVETHEREIVSQFPQAQQTLDQFRQATGTLAQVMPDWTVAIALRDTLVDSTTAPNTIGILEGTDARLRREYVVYSAHMDHIGITPGRPDSINNGADDDGSGTVGIMELAEAFSQKGARPKRSMLFMTVSGEEKGLWGSQYFVAHPTVPLASLVADLNLDMIGRNWKDTIVAIGKEHSDLGATLTRVNARHAELRMTAIDDIWPEERFYFRSDHYNFARHGVPILFFFNGTHQDYHEVSDSPDKIDGEKESRILRLLFYLGQEVANAPARPQWNAQSYQEIVQDGKE